MIHGLDSAYAPSAAQLAEAKQLGFSLWAGYFAGPNLEHGWAEADFARVEAAGLASIAFCSGYSDPTAMKAQSRLWGVRICLDVEGGIRPDGNWVQGWLNVSGAGLYGNLPVHRGRLAAFHILADFVDTNPGATWLAGAGSYRPAGPCGWQWHGTTSLFGMSVDKANYDDWFAPAQGAAGAATGSRTGGQDEMNLTDVKGVLIAAAHGVGRGSGTGPGVVTQADIDASAKRYMEGVPLDVLVAEVVSTQDAKAYEAGVAKLLAAPAPVAAASATHKHRNDGVDPASALTSEPV